jgi:hypothetical protein
MGKPGLGPKAGDENFKGLRQSSLLPISFA